MNKATVNNELLPCPFCGREVTIKKRCLKDWRGEVTMRYYRIACSCGAGTHKEYKTETAAIINSITHHRQNSQRSTAKLTLTTCHFKG